MPRHRMAVRAMRPAAYPLRSMHSCHMHSCHMLLLRHGWQRCILAPWQLDLHTRCCTPIGSCPPSSAGAANRKRFAPPTHYALHSHTPLSHALSVTHVPQTSTASGTARHASEKALPSPIPRTSTRPALKWRSRAWCRCSPTRSKTLFLR